MNKRHIVGSRWGILLGIGISLLVLGFLGLMIWRANSARWMDKNVLLEGETGEELPKVYWETLAELDFQSGRVPAQLKKLDRQMVEVPGFAVPLEDDLQAVREFLLVPNRMACIHAPPPPPNQMVLIQMAEPQPVGDLMGPLWVTGELWIVDTKSKYGSATYEMKAHRVRPYVPESQ